MHKIKAVRSNPLETGQERAVYSKRVRQYDRQRCCAENMWFDYVDIHVEGSKQHLQSDSNRNLKQKNKLQIIPDIRKPWNNPCCEAHLVFERDHNFEQNGGGASEQIKIQRDDVVPQELMLICLFYTLCWLNDPLYISFLIAMISTFNSITSGCLSDKDIQLLKKTYRKLTELYYENKKN
jgi:hypothetical protein